MKKIFTLAIACLAISISNAQLLERDFLSAFTSEGVAIEKGEYPSTTQGETNLIMADQWNLSGKAKDANDTNNGGGVSPLTATPLTYAGYAESGKDYAIDLLKLESGGRTTIYSLANDYTYGAGTYYIAFMAKVTQAGSVAEFFSVDGNYTGNAQRVRYSVKSNDDDSYFVGLGGNTSAVVNEAGEPLKYGETYLVVIKATLTEDTTNPGRGTGAGTASLYINPSLDTEPATAYHTVNIEGTALKSIRGLVIRQRNTLAAQIGGFRLAQSWASVINDSGTGISNGKTTENNIRTSGNTILTNAAGVMKLIDLSGMEVINQPTDGSLACGVNKGLYIAQFTDVDGNVTIQKIVIR